MKREELKKELEIFADFIYKDTQGLVISNELICKYLDSCKNTGNKFIMYCDYCEKDTEHRVINACNICERNL